MFHVCSLPRGKQLAPERVNRTCFALCKCLQKSLQARNVHAEFSGRVFLSISWVLTALRNKWRLKETTSLSWELEFSQVLAESLLVVLDYKVAFGFKSQLWALVIQKFTETVVSAKISKYLGLKNKKHRKENHHFTRIFWRATGVFITNLTNQITYRELDEVFGDHIDQSLSFSLGTRKPMVGFVEGTIELS